MLKKTLERKLLKIEKKALKDNKKDYLLMVKETKQAKGWDEFGKSWGGEYYLANSAAYRLYSLKSERLNKAKKEQDFKKFKEIFIKLLEKTYKKDLKRFGIKWAGVWAAVSGGTNRNAGECSVAYGCCNRGGGYDKASTATANALNQIRQALGVALRVKNETGAECYGLYFSPRSGVLSFSGGVGSSCFENIFRLAGYHSVGVSFDGVVNLIKR